MESNGAFNAEMNTSEEPHSRSRSRSPINKSPKERRMSSSRDSSVTRERERQPKGNRSRAGTGGRNRAPSNRRVYVANIGYDSKWTEIKDLFREKVGDVSYVELFEDENGKFRGCGIVEFKEPGSVQKAIDILHRFEFKGRQLVIKEDFDVERDKTGRPVTRSNRGRGDRDGGRSSFGLALSNPQYNTYGLSPQFLEALGITGPLSKRIFVANLDYKVSTKKLQDIFKMAGKVMHIELKTDKDGNSKGHGTIEFEHPVEAVQAISMLNGQKLFNRTMSVRMDKFKEELDGVPSKLPDGLQGLGKGLGAGGQPLQLNNN